jgi:SAM-dependent methyltransferase
MAGKFDPGGLVLATDLDTRFLEGIQRPQLIVRRHNIQAGELDTASFDLVHARAVLEHLADPQDAVNRMVLALKPGGWLVVEDADLGDLMIAARAAYIHPAVLAPSLTKAARAFAQLFARGGGNPELATRLPDVLSEVGLEEVDGETRLHLVRPGTPGARFMELSLEQLGDRLVAASLLSEEDLASIRRALISTDARWSSNAMTAVWGRKVGAQRGT